MQAHELQTQLLKSCDAKSAAIRARIRLIPIGGEGAKVAPPTYAGTKPGEGGQYAFETRRTASGGETRAVLLESIASQANRIEEVLLTAYRNGLPVPVMEMVIPGRENVTSLTAPHRVHDAIFRDALLEGKPFRESEPGKRIVAARAWNATALYEFCPTALLLGTWDSQSGGGVTSAKFARALVSEIIALDAVRGVRTASRIDPLGIKAMAASVYQSANPQQMWTLESNEAAKDKNKPKLFGKKGKPSEINHGNIAPSITGENGPGGVTFSEAIQTTVLSFTQLRKLHFPSTDGKPSHERDIAGRAVLAALGLYAIVLQWSEGYQLRSGCQLLPIENPQFELIGNTAGDIQPLDFDAETARAAFDLARKHAESLDLRWRSGRIDLVPQAKLLKLIELSDAIGEDLEEA
jgi:CRISPR-associated protein Csb1